MLCLDLLIIDGLRPIRFTHKVTSNKWSTMMRSFGHCWSLRVSHRLLKQLNLSLRFFGFNYCRDEFVHIVCLLHCNTMSLVIFLFFWVIHLTLARLTALLLRLLLHLFLNPQGVSKLLHLHATLIKRFTNHWNIDTLTLHKQVSWLKDLILSTVKT